LKSLSFCFSLFAHREVRAWGETNSGNGGYLQVMKRARFPQLKLTTRFWEFVAGNGSYGTAEQAMKIDFPDNPHRPPRHWTVLELARFLLSLTELGSP
jgi:hypothetical protein